MQDTHRELEDQPTPFLLSANDHTLPTIPSVTNVATTTLRPRTGKTSTSLVPQLAPTNPDPPVNQAQSAEYISQQVRDMEQMVENLEVRRRSSVSKRPIASPPTTT